MKHCILVLGILLSGVSGLPVWAAPGAARAAMENEMLRVEADPASGRITVLDRRTGHTWGPPDSPGGDWHGPELVFPRLTGPAPADGPALAAPVLRLGSELRTADAPQVDGEADCSAVLLAGWDDAFLYVTLRVRDDRFAFPAAEQERWWDSDSVEFWVGDRQLALVPVPGAAHVRRHPNRVPEARLDLTADPAAGTYDLVAAVPWSVLGVETPKPGTRFAFALGVNDADAGTREGQLYFPPTWRHSQPNTFATAVLGGTDGTVPAAPEAAARAVFRGLAVADSGREISFETDADSPAGFPVLVRLSLPADAPELRVVVDTPDRGRALTGDLLVLSAFVADMPGASLAVADYSNGHLYPLDTEPFPARWHNMNRMDMPWVGLTDAFGGMGYALIIETSDDGVLSIEDAKSDGAAVRLPRLRWRGSRGTFAYPRAWRYVFADRGGYVRLAKAYREYAREQGLLVTLEEKARANPNVRRLFGAPDVWGDIGIGFAEEAKSLGVEKMLIHGQSGAANLAAVNELGYLTSKYDNYTDILPADTRDAVDHVHGVIPDDAVQRPDGSRMEAWLTFDGKTQYMKRCPALWLDAARKDIPAELATLPYLGRFIDVTTAEGLYECFDPKHPLSHAEKRAAGVELEGYVRDLGLVGGGEHGIWWGVPAMCYVEGMMSSNHYFSWPAGHLIHPKTKDEALGNPWGYKMPTWEQYERYGIGHETRIPLWELVFHDCIVTTWYWGDSSDWLLQAAPEVTAKKDAFNILYGTMPMMWANAEGSWMKDRDVFLTTYRNTCKLHEIVATEELISHEFVTDDMAVQRSVFASGTEAVVNFGEEPRKVTVGGEEFVLPRNGFAVRGPEIEQSLALENGEAVTSIRTANYRFRRDRAGAFSASSAGPGAVVLRGDVSGRAIDPGTLAAGTDLRSALLYRLNEAGEPVGTVPFRVERGCIVADAGDARVLKLLAGEAAQKPDVAFATPPSIRGRRGVPGTRFMLETAIVNVGLARTAATVTAYADRVDPDRILGQKSLRAGAGDTDRIRFALQTDRLAGPTTVVVRVSCDDEEICTLNNTATLPLDVIPDASAWRARIPVRVEVAETARANDTAEVFLDLTRLVGIPPRGIDPASVRVAVLSARGDVEGFVPAQFEPAAEFHPETAVRGTLFWRTGELVPGTPNRYAVLVSRGDHPLLAAASSRVHPGAEPGEIVFSAETYEVRFGEFVIGSVRPIGAGGSGPEIIRKLVFSSERTGWDREIDARTDAFDVVADGPVRTVLRAKRELRDGVAYEKHYVFYPDRFDVIAAVNDRANGLYSRGWYTLPATFVDNEGKSAAMDGDGAENETFYGVTKNPKWFALFGDGWAHSCTARTPMDHVAYWDGPGALGQIGFASNEMTDVRMTYVFHAQTFADAGFAESDARIINDPPRVTVEATGAAR